MKKWTSDSGYSLLETMMTLAIFGTVAAMAAFQIGISRPGFKGDGAMRTVMSQLNVAREQAITQRRVMRILFTTPNTVQIVRENFPVSGGTTIISTIPFEGGISYGLTTGLPDTPDAFGKTTAVYFGTATQFRFNTEGMLVDQVQQPDQRQRVLDPPWSGARGARRHHRGNDGSRARLQMGRQSLEDGLVIMRSPRSQSGSSLVEVVIAMGVLTVGALGVAGVFTSGMQRASSSPGDLIATQKAAEAVESVFAARDTHKLTWAEIRNVQGETLSDGGVFEDGKKQLRDPGEDGLVNTVDDGDIEKMRYPGRDRLMRTVDDTFTELGTFWREIKITRVRDDLRVITVTVTYQAGQQPRVYKLTTYISNLS